VTELGWTLSPTVFEEGLKNTAKMFPESQVGAIKFPEKSQNIGVGEGTRLGVWSMLGPWLRTVKPFFSEAFRRISTHSFLLASRLLNDQFNTTFEWNTCLAFACSAPFILEASSPIDSSYQLHFCNHALIAGLH